jgi:UDP-N-acetylmuramoylalanine--D-glutamate ligase
LIATILARDPSCPVELGGNNGKPLIGRAAALPAETRVVIELSELQLPSLHSAVDVGVFTNVTVDHLDRHGTVGAYRSVKRLLADRIADDGVMVVNLDDPVVAAYAGIGRVETVAYRQSPPIPGGVGIVDGWIVAAGVLRAPRFGGGAAATGPSGRIMPVGEIALPGEHSVSNVLAAVSVALVAGVAPDAIRSAVSSFTGIPHRLETVAVINGIRYVNDSQATQPDAVAAAVRSFPKPLVLIAGGRSKGLDLVDLAPIVAERCSAAVVMGELADELEALFRSAGLTRIERATSVESAVEVGTKVAQEIGAAGPDGIRATLLLSPIGSSFDMYNNPFGARGEAFRAAVLARVESSR